MEIEGYSELDVFRVYKQTVVAGLEVLLDFACLIQPVAMVKKRQRNATYTVGDLPGF